MRSRVVRLVPLAAALVAALPAAPAGAVPHAGDPAPPFAVAAARGGPVSLKRYAGRPLYLNFFASWCVPCNAEAPSIARLYRKYRGRGLAVVGVDEEEEPPKALAFARKYGWPFALAMDDEGDVGRKYGLVLLPVHVFIDRAGNVSTYRLGEMNPDEIETAIRKAL